MSERRQARTGTSADYVRRHMSGECHSPGVYDSVTTGAVLALSAVTNTSCISVAWPLGCYCDMSPVAEKYP